MSEITNPELCCLNTMLSLENNPAAPKNIKKNTNTLEILTSQGVKEAWELTTDPSVPGKNPPSLPSANPGANKVRRYYKYEKPNCDETVQAASTGICDDHDSTTDPMGYIVVDINQAASKAWKLSADEFAEACGGVSARRANKLRRAAATLRLDANKKIITNLYGLVDNYANGDNALTATRALNLISDKGDINPVEMAKISGEYRDSMFDGEWVMIGGSNLATYFDVMKYRLSPEGKMGLDLNLEDFPFIYDSSFDPIFQNLAGDSDSHAVTIPVGSIFVDIWNENTGDKIINMPHQIATTIEIDGIMYDYELAWIQCDKVWKEKLTLHWGIGGIPDAAYCDNNGLVRNWKIGCGAPGCV